MACASIHRWQRQMHLQKIWLNSMINYTMFLLMFARWAIVPVTASPKKRCRFEMAAVNASGIEVSPCIEMEALGSGSCQ